MVTERRFRPDGVNLDNVAPFVLEYLFIFTAKKLLGMPYQQPCLGMPGGLFCFVLSPRSGLWAPKQVTIFHLPSFVLSLLFPQPLEEHQAIESVMLQKGN